MSWCNFVFDKLIRDLTPEEVNWIEEHLGGGDLSLKQALLFFEFLACRLRPNSS